MRDEGICRAGTGVESEDQVACYSEGTRSRLSMCGGLQFMGRIEAVVQKYQSYLL